MVFGKSQRETLPVSIELNSHCVRMMQLRREKANLHVIDAAMLPIDVGKLGLLSHDYAHEMRKAVRTIFNTHRFKGRFCNVAIDESLVKVKSVRQPRMPDDEMAQGHRAHRR